VPFLPVEADKTAKVKRSGGGSVLLCPLVSPLSRLDFTRTKKHREGHVGWLKRTAG